MHLVGALVTYHNALGTLATSSRKMYTDTEYQTQRRSDALGMQSSRPYDCLNEGLDLRAQSKEFLVERVVVLERQLKIRNSDCSRLLLQKHMLSQQQSSGIPQFNDVEKVSVLEQEVKELRRRNKELEYLLSLNGKNVQSNEMLASLSSPYSPSLPPQQYGNRVAILNSEAGSQVPYGNRTSNGFPLNAPSTRSLKSQYPRHYDQHASCGSAQTREENELRARLAAI